MRSRNRSRFRRWLLAGAALVASLVDMSLLVPDAQAIIGRPLTPLSFAGVARRTTRRAVAGAVVVGAAARPYPYYW